MRRRLTDCEADVISPRKETSDRCLSIIQLRQQNGIGHGWLPRPIRNYIVIERNGLSHEHNDR